MAWILGLFVKGVLYKDCPVFIYTASGLQQSCLYAMEWKSDLVQWKINHINYLWINQKQTVS